MHAMPGGRVSHGIDAIDRAANVVGETQVGLHELDIVLGDGRNIGGAHPPSLAHQQAAHLSPKRPAPSGYEASRCMAPPSVGWRSASLRRFEQIEMPPVLLTQHNDRTMRSTWLSQTVR